MTKRTAYTKIDLLVTVMCVSVLMLCLGAVGLNGREMAKRTVCAANVNLNLEAMLTYAYDSDGELPGAGITGFPQDFPYVHACQFVQDYGMHKEAFYCPSNPNQQRWMDAFYYFSVSPGNPSNYHSSSFIVTGYIYLLDTHRPFLPRSPIRGYPDKQWLSNIYVDNPDEAELVIDATFSIRREGYPNGDFQHNVGGIYAGNSASGLGEGVYDSSSHLKTDAEPWGANIGYLDGHVYWRPFDQMEHRYTAGRDFWW